jgi:hypothetical protein
MTLRTQVIGRIEVTRHLERVLGQVPYGRPSMLRHVVGGAGGGGFEWTAGPGADHLADITALELDADGPVRAGSAGGVHQVRHRADRAMRGHPAA